MKDLRLSLKTKWFKMTESGEKKEDYREITPYWIRRLTNIRYDKSFCSDDMVCESMKSWSHKELDDYFEGKFKSFDQNTLTLGYPKASDTSRIIKYGHAGIEIRTGNPGWGAEPGKVYFVIKHGERIK